MITKEQLQAMSDDEANQLLTALLAGGDWVEHGELNTCQSGESFLVIHNAIGDPFFLDVVDYCNTPNDIMPLAFEHDVTFVKSAKCAYQNLEDGYYGFDHDEYYNEENPLRAIACCLILVLQEKQK